MARARATAAGTDNPGAANAPAVLGARIRHARRLAQLTMTQVADRADCSASLISKIESGQAAPSLAMLHRIAVALDTNIARLTEEGPVDTPVLRSGQRAVLKTGGIALEPLTLPKRGGLLQANIHIVEVGAASDGQIVHAGEEVGYVLEGELELTLGDELHPIRTGDSFTFSSQVPHGYRNIGSGVARILWVNTPATF
jgi:transcriptional regulator with XRE-family HTH domain